MWITTFFLFSVCKTTFMTEVKSAEVDMRVFMFVYLCCLIVMLVCIRVLVCQYL